MNINDIPIYLIYLPNYQHRWEPTLHHLIESGITPVLFHGIDAISWKLKSDLSENKYPKNFTSGRIGCFLSHFMLWNHLQLINNWDTAIIFEDDVRISKTFVPRLNTIVKELPLNWDFVHLGSFWGDLKPEKQYSENLLIGKPYCTHAYMIKKTTLPILMEKCYTMEFYLDIQLNKKVLPKINHFVVNPSMAHQKSLDNLEEYRSLCKDWKSLL
jgi:GR25 family glycosyltransferase involved in LPS biosynthesis